MRQIIIDTETTGLYPNQGHRIIEIAGLEVIDRHVTGRTVHFRLDPERDIDFGATEVHGMTWEDLRGKPKFRDVAVDFVTFAQDAQWVIHNAPFDVSFLDVEFDRAGLPCCADVHHSVVDTLALARDLFPGKRNSLDALCERFRIDNAQRTLHGALLDAQLLAEVYLAMTRGQETLTIDMGSTGFALGGIGAAGTSLLDDIAARAPLAVMLPSPEEWSAHRDYLAALARESKGHCVWLELESEIAPAAVLAVS